MARLTICDSCSETQPISQRNWYTITFTDNNRNPAEPPFTYDLCMACAKALAAREYWIMFT